ncbi:hypothetical protein, partial [Burkholderia cenocepacia]|uniref:hypothetical protein n=1 Tax=Burkholderia cenocepacia TaxID=95486 RepID=UPI00222F0D28
MTDRLEAGGRLAGRNDEPRILPGTLVDRRRGRMRVFLSLGLVALTSVAAAQLAQARDPDGRYANSPLKEWFDGLRSGKGPCCSDADGSAVSDVDWESKNGHYRVRLDGTWIDVPDEAVVTEPNRAGRAMV